MLSIRRLARPLALLALAAALAAPGAVAKAPDEINVFVWKATRADQPDARPDYLLGTMHVGLKPGFKVPASVENDIRTSTRFVMEVDTDNINPLSVAKYVAIEPGQNLKKLLPAKSWKKLVTLMKPKGIGEEQLKGLDPWFLAVMSLNLKGGGEEGILDDRLRKQAKTAQVAVTYLETAEQQFKSLDSVAMKEDLKQLEEIINDPDRPIKELATLEAAYLSGDLTVITGMLFDAPRMKEYPDFYNKLFFDRNNRWLPKVDALMQKEDTFVAVGLGHLLGDRGLVALLRQRGYTVEPVVL